MKHNGIAKRCLISLGHIVRQGTQLLQAHCRPAEQASSSACCIAHIIRIKALRCATSGAQSSDHTSQYAFSTPPAIRMQCTCWADIAGMYPCVLWGELLKSLSDMQIEKCSRQFQC